MWCASLHAAISMMSCDCHVISGNRGHECTKLNCRQFMYWWKTRNVPNSGGSLKGAVRILYQGCPRKSATETDSLPEKRYFGLFTTSWIRITTSECMVYYWFQTNFCAAKRIALYQSIKLVISSLEFAKITLFISVRMNTCHGKRVARWVLATMLIFASFQLSGKSVSKFCPFGITVVADGYKHIEYT